MHAVILYVIAVIAGCVAGSLSASNGSGKDPLKDLWVQSLLVTAAIVGAEVLIQLFSLSEWKPLPGWFTTVGTFWFTYLAVGAINHVWYKNRKNRVIR